MAEKKEDELATTDNSLAEAKEELCRRYLCFLVVGNRLDVAKSWRTLQNRGPEGV